MSDIIDRLAHGSPRGSAHGGARSVTPDMNVTFKIAEGSCWSARPTAPPAA